MMGQDRKEKLRKKKVITMLGGEGLDVRLRGLNWYFMSCIRQY
jgi:hypothetical protein